MSWLPDAVWDADVERLTSRVQEGLDLEVCDAEVQRVSRRVDRRLREALEFELSDEEKVRLLPMIPRWTPFRRSGGVVDDEAIMSTARNALRRYNADHSGQEFDAFWPVMEESVHFQGHPWVHANILARRRGGSRTIRRFFAELCYHDCSAPPTVHACTIIEEPLNRYRSSCGICRADSGILHPLDDDVFACGNGSEDDWVVEKEWGRLRFMSRPKSHLDQQQYS